MWPITDDKTRDRTPGLLDRGGKSIHVGGPSWPSGDVVQVLDLFGFLFFVGWGYWIVAALI